MQINSIQDTLTNLEDKQLNEFQKQIEKALVKFNNMVELNLLNDISNPLEYEMAIQSYLQESGYYKAVNLLIDNGFDVVYGSVLDGLTVGGIALSYTQDDLVKINTLKQLAFDKFNALAADSMTQLKTSLYKYSLSNASSSDIANDMKAQLENSNLAKYSRTYAETAISEYTQQMINMKSQDYDGVWLYVGVNDGKTRPFCKHLLGVGKAYNDADKLKLENDPKRRWNCRHHFWKVSEEFAVDNGYKS